MPRVTETIVDGWAHCVNPRCDGSPQQPVQAIRQVVEHTYVEGGGDMPGIEKTHVYLRFSDPADGPCPTDGCGLAREVSDQKRRRYENLSGHSQSGLLEYKPPEFHEVG